MNHSSCEIVGLIRFSIITRNAENVWAIARGESTSGYRSDLLTQRRLERRFALFEAITLPSLDAQIDGDFSVVVLASSLLPDEYKYRLRSLSLQRPYLIVKYFPEHTTLGGAVAHSLAHFDNSREKLVTFRIDDDDALASTYTADLRSTALQCESDTVISYPTGLYLRRTSEDMFELAEVYRSKLALGLARVTPAPARDHVFQLGNHARIADDQVNEVMTVAPMWIRTIYDESDSAAQVDAWKRHTIASARRVLRTHEVAMKYRERFPEIDFSKAMIALTNPRG